MHHTDTTRTLLSWPPSGQGSSSPLPAGRGGGEMGSLLPNHELPPAMSSSRQGPRRVGLSGAEAGGSAARVGSTGRQGHWGHWGPL